MSTTNATQNHAPSHVREDFLQWLNSYEPDRLKEFDISPVESLLDALTECGDVLPADYCDQLEISKGSTYAQAVEEVRQWHAKQRKHGSKRSAEDVYWKFVEKAGEETCADAVINYFDRNTAVEVLLERIDADSLEEFLHDSLIADQVWNPVAPEQTARLDQLATDYCFLCELSTCEDTCCSKAVVTQRIVSILQDHQDPMDACLSLRRSWLEYPFSEQRFAASLLND